jgi:nitrogenase-associated protein
MTRVVFYEKPGCVNNARQRTRLRELGHEVVARDLLQEPWTAERLEGFFRNRPVHEWFNPSAPRIKSGEVVPGRLDGAQALELMIDDPLLIRRPLIESELGVSAGFDQGALLGVLGVRIETDIELKTCPQDETGLECATDGAASR